MSISDKQFKKVLDVALDYGAGYGKCNIIETPNHIIFEFYNAGWSTCEADDSKLMRQVQPEVNNHPISIYTFKKGYLEIDTWNKLEMVKRKKYQFTFRRD